MLSLEKICARNEYPDGIFRKPVCEDIIVCPFATVTPIREKAVHGWMSVRTFLSRTAIYVPVDPESALIFCGTENLFAEFAECTL